MLFHVTWEFTDTSEIGAKRSLNVFRQWQPAAGANFVGFYSFADGSGGVAIVEVDSSATLAKVTAPFSPWLRFRATPIVPVQDGAAISGEAIAWLSSVK
jgi:hypothetical protein